MSVNHAPTNTTQISIAAQNWTLLLFLQIRGQHVTAAAA
jgi:hypothetical protein